MNRSTVSPSVGVVESDEMDEGPLETSAGTPAEAAQGEWREASVDAASHGLRLDKWLVSLAPEFSRSHLQGLLELGQVRYGDQVLLSASRKVTAGQRIGILLTPTAQSNAFKPEAMELPIVYEDASLLVLNKPAGLVVHPAAGHWSGTLLNGLLAHHAGAAFLPRAGIVHRLDKDTSGLMVVAKTLEAQTALTREIAARTVQREYLAIVHGHTGWTHLTIDAPMARDPVSRIRMAIVSSGKEARTDVWRLEGMSSDADSVLAGRLAGYTAVRCKLYTGRTHQIRVHLASRGHPLVADALYGGVASLGLQRQALHAMRLAFVHPLSGQEQVFFAPLPPDLQQAWGRLNQRASDALSMFGYNG
jgi:23S rRNA pseudouridine1911/1915/1917 synthase